MNRYGGIITILLILLMGNIYGDTLVSESMNSNIVLDINENLIDYDFFRSTLSTQHALSELKSHAGYLSYSDQLHVAFLSNQLVDTIIEFSLLLHIGEAIGINMGQTALDNAKKDYLTRLEDYDIDHEHYRSGLLNYANLIGKKRYIKQAILNRLEMRISPAYINQMMEQAPGLSLVNKKIAYEGIKITSSPIIHELKHQRKWKKIKKLTRSAQPIAIHQTIPKAFDECPATVQELLLKLTHRKHPVVYDDGHHIWALSVTDVRDNPDDNTEAEKKLNQAAAQLYLANWLTEASQYNTIKVNKDYIMGLRPTNSIIQDWVPKIEYFIDSPITKGNPNA